MFFVGYNVRTEEGDPLLSPGDNVDLALGIAKNRHWNRERGALVSRSVYEIACIKHTGRISDYIL